MSENAIAEQPEQPASKKVYSLHAVFVDDREQDVFSADLVAALDGFSTLRATLAPVVGKDDLAAAMRTTVREPAGGEWRPYEIAFAVNYVGPRSVGRAVIAVSPPVPKGFNDPYCDGRPIKLSALVAGEGCGDVFKLVQVFVGTRELLPPSAEARALNCGPVPFAAENGEDIVLGVGGAITIYVQNTGKERRSFAGRLVGQQKATVA